MFFDMDFPPFLLKKDIPLSYPICVPIRIYELSRSVRFPGFSKIAYQSVFLFLPFLLRDNKKVHTFRL